MESKGICSTCVSDADCTFPRKFPVIQCEEFSTEPWSKEEKNQEQEKIKSEEEHIETE